MNDYEKITDAIFDEVLSKQYEKEKREGGTLSPWVRDWARKHRDEARLIRKKIRDGDRQ